jgi:FKBP-type peptidyl-prolyl cis-trans isomerase SlyD
MIISQHHVVTVSYQLFTPELSGNERFVEQTTEDSPLAFIMGVGQLLPDFEQNLLGKKVGDTFDFYITAENGYGLPDPQAVVDIPKNIFFDESGNFDDETFQVGNTIPMVNSQGHRMMGIVREVSADSLKMDFNHPLAGCGLHFKGEVLEVRQADPSELAHGHVHGPGGHHH